MGHTRRSKSRRGPVGEWKGLSRREDKSGGHWVKNTKIHYPYGTVKNKKWKNLKSLYIYIYTHV